jgi:hypothetical protein
MRKIILSTAFAFAATAGALVISSPASAVANNAWCASSIEGNSSLDCSFVSYQQCQAFVSGRGGQCDMNVNTPRNWQNTQARFMGSFAAFAPFNSYEDTNRQRP